MLIAALIGTGPIADAFFVALKLPNLFRRLFGEGAFNAAFIPEFTGILHAEGRPAARQFAEEAFAVMTFWLCLMTIAGEVFMPQTDAGPRTRIFRATRRNSLSPSTCRGSPFPICC